MKKFVFGLAAFGVVSVASGCVSESPTPAARAASMERLQCTDPRQSQEELRALQGTAVVRAEPTYFLLNSGAGSGAGRISGTKLLVRPPQGVSALDLNRALQCHSARMLLGQVDPAAFPDDPYFLPDAWVDIDVKPEDGLLAVRLTADKVPQNLALLHRATAFADAHRTATTP
jgi:hypothetical protein